MSVRAGLENAFNDVLEDAAIFLLRLEERGIGPLAFDRTIACCEKNGFRPNIVQDGTHWPTLVRLVAAGLGVSLAPACVASVGVRGAVYREVHAACRTTIDLGVKTASVTTLAGNFMDAAREYLGT